jgi:perosamine synthetase
MRQQGVDTRPFFLPAQDMPPYAEATVVGVNDADTPVSRRLADSGLNLPSSPGLTADELQRCVAALASAVTSELPATGREP